MPFQNYQQHFGHCVPRHERDGGLCSHKGGHRWVYTIPGTAAYVERNPGQCRCVSISLIYIFVLSLLMGTQPGSDLHPHPGRYARRQINGESRRGETSGSSWSG